VPTRVPAAGSWTGAENKNPAEHTPAKTNTDPEAIAAGTANASSDDKAKDKSNEDTFAKCPPEEKSEETKTQEERQATTQETAANEDATLTSGPDQTDPRGREQRNDPNRFAGADGPDPREIQGSASLTDSEGPF
jgi:hypothetical protein